MTQATTRFGTEVAYDERFVEYAGGMAATFITRLNSGRKLDPLEIDWLYKTTGNATTNIEMSQYRMCQQLIDQMLIQRTTLRLKS